MKRLIVFSSVHLETLMRREAHQGNSELRGRKAGQRTHSCQALGGIRLSGAAPFGGCRVSQ